MTFVSYNDIGDVKEIEKLLNKDFKNVYDWFVDNKLSIYSGEDETKSLLFASKHKIKIARKVNIKYKYIKLKETFEGYVSVAFWRKFFLGNLWP